MTVTSTNHLSPDWAFQLTLPATNATLCGHDWINVHWTGQVDIRTGSAHPPNNQGVGLKCEIQQGTKIIPCAGASALRPFGPFIGRNDYNRDGEQVHGSFMSIVLTPQFVDGDPATDITVRIGFYHNSNATVQPTVINQTLSVETGFALFPL